MNMPEVSAQDLEPGRWYWWVLPHLGRPDAQDFDKYCVVRCLTGDDGQPVVNISANLERDETYDADLATGRFFGPVPPPDYRSS
jgi:hypothetical protein